MRGAALVAAMSRHVISIAVGVVTVALVGHRLGGDALGVWALIGTSSFLLGLADLGIPVAAQRAQARSDAAAARQGVGVAITAIAVVAPALAIVSTIWLVPLADGIAGGDGAAILGAIAGVITAFGSPARAIAVITPGAMRALAWSRAIGAFVQLAVMVGVFAVEASLVAPSLGLVAAALVETSLAWRIVRARVPGIQPAPRLPRDRRELFAIARDASATLVINLAVAAAVRADVALVAASGSLLVVAAYSLGGRTVDQLYSLAKQVSTAALPDLREGPARSRAVRTSVARIGGIAAAGLVAVALAGTPLLVAWAGPVAATPLTAEILGTLSIAAIVAAVAEIPAATLTLGGRSAWSAALPIATGSAINFAIGVSCVGTLGPHAVAIATVVGNLVNAWWTWRRARVLLGWSYADVARALLPVVAAGAVSAAVSLAMQDLVVGVWSSMAVCATSACLGIVTAEAVSRRDTALVPGLLMPRAWLQRVSTSRKLDIPSC